MWLSNDGKWKMFEFFLTVPLIIELPAHQMPFKSLLHSLQTYYLMPEKQASFTLTHTNWYMRDCAVCNMLICVEELRIIYSIHSGLANRAFATSWNSLVSTEHAFHCHICRRNGSNRIAVGGWWCFFMRLELGCRNQDQNTVYIRKHPEWLLCLISSPSPSNK